MHTARQFTSSTTEVHGQKCWKGCHCYEGGRTRCDLKGVRAVPMTLVWFGEGMISQPPLLRLRKCSYAGVGFDFRVSWGLVVVDKYHDYWICLGLAWMVTPQYIYIFGICTVKRLFCPLTVSVVTMKVWFISFFRKVFLQSQMSGVEKGYGHREPSLVLIWTSPSSARFEPNKSTPLMCDNSDF